MPRGNPSTVTRQARADHGYQSVAAYARSAIATGALPSGTVNDEAPEVLIAETLQGLAHLCDRLGLDGRALFADAMNAARNAWAGPAAHAQLFNTAAHVPRWGDVPAPRPPAAAHPAVVLSWLQQAGHEGVTSTELRARGVANPSQVIAALIASGHRVQRNTLPKQHGAGQYARYQLLRD